MINFRIVSRIAGSLLMLQSAAMVFSFLVALLYNEPEAAGIAQAGAITFISGFIIWFPFRKNATTIGRREGYIIVTGTYVIFSIFGTLPYILTRSIPLFSHALFESVSGYTATGATILEDIEALSHGILFYRSLTQWMGGMGFILLSLAILGEIKIGNFQLFAAEVPGVTKDKIHPKVSGTAKRLWAIYLSLTLSAAILLRLAGMSVFDAVCHSFTTMATGGYSTKNASIAAFDSLYIHAVITTFMFVGGINFALIYFVLKGKFRKMLRNDEFRFYTAFTFIFCLIVSSGLWLNDGYDPADAIVEGSFQVVSILTTTGFTTVDYQTWSHYLVLILFMLMFTGGSTGSTSGGIKMLRILILTRNSGKELNKMIHPNAVFAVRINGKAIDRSLISNVLAFTVLYFVVIGASVLVISFMDYDIVTSFGAAAATLGNIGPAIGDVGPAFDYAHMPMFGKYFLSGLMIIGRLELFTVLILFSRSFYKS